MLALRDGQTLYHGRYTLVDAVDLEKCAPGKDFGRGFYLTSSKEQAESFVPLSIRRHASEIVDCAQETGFVSAFRVNLHQELSVHVFSEAGVDWLHFVAANRQEDLFPGLLERYADIDVIIGKIANDRTARTLQLYVAGAYGEPGSAEADSIAIATLLPNRLEDQFCFRTDRGLECLVFEGGEVCGIR